MRFFFLGAIGLGIVGAAQNEKQAFLERVNQRVRAMDNMICVQSSDRTQMDRDGQQLSSDRIRFEVLVTEGRETYSFVGADRWVRDVRPLIPYGLFDHGSWYSHLQSVAVNRKVQLSKDGNDAADWAFRMPSFHSDFEVHTIRASARVGYEGVIRSEPGGQWRLDLKIPLLPLETWILSYETTIHYGPGQEVSAVNEGFSGPLWAESTTKHLDGKQTRIRTIWSGCRAFLATSQILDDPPTLDGAPNALLQKGSAKVSDSVQPQQIVSEATVDFAAVNAGDVIPMRIRVPVKVSGSKRKSGEWQGQVRVLQKLVHPSAKLVTFGLVLEALTSSDGKRIEVEAESLKVEANGADARKRFELARRAKRAQEASDGAKSIQERAELLEVFDLPRVATLRFLGSAPQSEALKIKWAIRPVGGGIATQR